MARGRTPQCLGDFRPGVARQGDEAEGLQDDRAPEGWRGIGPDPRVAAPGPHRHPLRDGVGIQVLARDESAVRVDVACHRIGERGICRLACCESLEHVGVRPIAEGLALQWW